MPYIKRIEIDGFKTFGLKTALSFDKGFTVITGPNGSGKTNIVDAVLFCLGELSAKRLRVENFSGLIFNGGGGSGIRKNIARVVIQFDNSDGRIPVETTTVTIAREIDRNGESIYRVNGRRVPRAHLIEVLSVAGISPYGHNIVLQGTLTKMAEISALERRKIIEDMLGIAQYDAEKVEAEQKLKEADIAIKTAIGQINEIQRRVESLERERNNLLRYNLLKKELVRLESIKISRSMRELKAELEKLTTELSRAEERIKWLSGQREALRARRREIENELRKLGLGDFQERNARMVEIEVNIRSLKARLTELLAKIDAERANINRLKGLREGLERQIESLKDEIKLSEEKIRQLTQTLQDLGRTIEEKQAIYDSMMEGLSRARSIFEEKARRISEIEGQLEKIRGERVNLERERAKLQSEISMHIQRLEDLENKKRELLSSCEKIRELLTGLEEIAQGQRKRLEDLKSALKKRVERRSTIEEEIRAAEKVAEMAKEALIRFETRRGVVEKIKPEELALKHLERLGVEGAISGIYGRLRNLIAVDGEYARAVEAAASGWLDALVVEDLNVAFACIEALRRTGIGRVKIIPINNLPRSVTNSTVMLEGTYGPISSLVRCDERYRPAVEFVLGDTVLAISDDAAIKAARSGFRAVTVNGNLYEAWGGVEGGFHRRHIDLSSFIPGDEALRNLEKAVSALRRLLDNREGIIREIEGEISRTQNEIMALSESLARVEGEIDRVKRNLSNAETQIRRIESIMDELRAYVESGRGRLSSIEGRLNELDGIERPLREELERLKGEVDLLRLHDLEKGRSEVAQEIILLKQRYNAVESEILTLRARVEDVLKRSLEASMARLDEVSKQIAVLENEVEVSIREEGEIRRKIEELEGVREALSREISEVRERISAFTSKIDSLEAEISRMDAEYDGEIKSANDLKIRLQAINHQINRLGERLRELGLEGPIELQESYSPDELESWLKAIEEELRRIGAVNQLAELQYEEEVSRFKKISMRLNELEREREAILKFIEEIEQKKIRVFMDAFNKINEKVSRYFSRLTGGGSAYLKLENPENPFAGGVEMIVQFPGKSPIPVSGASSGERSVSAVAFLLALQEFSPASFYLFDEIDAHLDAFHVERLGELLSSEAAERQLQFIVITLKPEMISKADKVYGVYGQNGVSRVVSMTFKGVTINGRAQ